MKTLFKLMIIGAAVFLLSLSHVAAQSGEEIAEQAPWGAGIPAIIMGVAILALVIWISKTAEARRNRKRREAETRSAATAAAISNTAAAPHATAATAAVAGGVYAAIAAAIHLYGEELHDVEDAVLTINKVSRTYSPWSSKIHGLNAYFGHFRFRR